MLSEHSICASCMISNNVVYKNGENIFAKPNETISDFMFSIYKHFEFDYSRFYKMDNLCKFGWLASEIILHGSVRYGSAECGSVESDSFEKENCLPEETGIVLLNANSSLDSDLKYLESVNDIASPALFVYTLPNIMIGEICIRNNFTGEDAFFVLEKFDSAFIKQYVDTLLDNTNLKRCICGWVELLGNEYKACLFLVEKKKNYDSKPFTVKQMDEIFNYDAIIKTL